MRQYGLVLALLILCALGVMSTYARLSETDDELFHTACGMEWWQKGTYTMQPLHPPLARVVDATLPYLYDIDNHTRQALAQESPRDTYMRKMILSRLGVLPFYMFSCILVFAWSRQLFGQSAALWSLTLYGLLSTVAAHGGLATTDMVYTTMLIWALKSFVDWLATPTIKHSALLGVSLGLALSSKFSTLVQWPVPVMIILVAQMLANYYQNKTIIPLKLPHIKHGFLIVLPIFIYMVCMVFRFSLAPLWQGIRDAANLSGHGYSVWFYEALNHRSVWYFFPVVFFFKTPLAFLASTLIGNAKIIAKRPLEIQQLFPLLAASALMAVSMTSHINLGVRHVLPLYPLLAIPAGCAMEYLWQSGRWKRDIAVALFAWQTLGYIQAYPEHIAYFNELAGPHPEQITLDSDYDWGQAMIMLDEALQKRNIDQVYLCVRKDAVWSAQTVVKARKLACPNHQVTGWVAVGRAFRLLNPDHFTWLGHPDAVEHIGATMDLYYFPSQ